MNAIITFDSTKESLLEMLRNIRQGKIQLPDFQRGWIWDDDRIVSLIASVSLSYPIGTVMMLQTGNEDVHLKARLVEGVVLDNPPEPERFILDGQQRLTSFLQAIYSDNPVDTRDARGARIRRWYYIDIAQAMNSDGDREEAIKSLPEDRKIINFRREVVADYSIPEKEYEAGLFPLSQVFNCADWRRGYNRFWGWDSEKAKLFDEFESEVIKRFEQYQVPLILMRKETPKEAVCQVFEKVNTGGVSLTVFELLTATYAADNFSLRDDWTERKRHLKEQRVLARVENTDFLQTVTLLTTYSRRLESIANGVQSDNAPGISCKRKEILRLSLDDYKTWADRATRGFEKAARFLHSQKIFTARDIPYQTQLVPLAAILAVLGDSADSDGAKAKLARWYWCGILGELYGGAIETRFARDLPEAVEWVSDGSEPSTISDANFVPERLYALRTRNSAAYKGLHALLLRDGCRDFRTGDPIDEQIYFEDAVDVHHIFPQHWCKNNGIDMKLSDSIVNKTPLSAKTNRIISGNAPSTYLPRVQKSSGYNDSRMVEILQSHVIEPKYLQLDNFDSFFKSRKNALLARIEKAMGKPVARVTTSQDFDTPEEELGIEE
jgi:hypothetical protein